MVVYHFPKGSIKLRVVVDQPDHVPFGFLTVKAKTTIGKDQGQLGFVFINPLEDRTNAGASPSSELHLAQFLDGLHRVDGPDPGVEMDQGNLLRIHHAEDGVDFTDEDLEFIICH